MFLDKTSTAAPVASSLLHASILARYATLDEATELVESLPPCGPASAVCVADAERFLRLETVVDDGIGWNTNVEHYRRQERTDEFVVAVTNRSTHRPH